MASQTALSSWPFSVNRYHRPRPVGAGSVSTMPCRSSVSRRSASNAVEMPGAPWRISVNVRQPLSRLRTMIGVQRSAISSDVRATGQYWP